jgi:hypothetical protein
MISLTDNHRASPEDKSAYSIVLLASKRDFGRGEDFPRCRDSGDRRIGHRL